MTTTILVPPGIGDGYWVLVKLRGFLESKGISMPEIWVHDSGPRRSGEMWSRVPFVRFAGYAEVPKLVPPKKPRRKVALTAEQIASTIAVKRAYTESGYPVQRKVQGFDYFLSFNGTLGHGRSLDEAMPGPVDWYTPIASFAEEKAHELCYRERWGSYVVAAFWDRGFYANWLREFDTNAIAVMLRTVADAGHTVVVMGAEWDKDGIGPRIAAQDARFVNLIGATSFAALLGLLSGAAGIIGFPAGNTLLGPYFRRPTVLLWNDHFNRNFWRNACPPDASNYKPVGTSGANPVDVANLLLEMIA